jgi:hypothetical protein
MCFGGDEVAPVALGWRMVFPGLCANGPLFSLRENQAKVFHQGSKIMQRIKINISYSSMLLTDRNEQRPEGFKCCRQLISNRRSALPASTCSACSPIMGNNSIPRHHLQLQSEDKLLRLRASKSGRRSRSQDFQDHYHAEKNKIFARDRFSGRRNFSNARARYSLDSSSGNTARG